MQQAKIVEIPPKMRKRFGRGKMLIPRPLDVDALIRKVPRGKLIAGSGSREIGACLRSGPRVPHHHRLVVRIVAEAGEEVARHAVLARSPRARLEKFTRRGIASIEPASCE